MIDGWNGRRDLLLTVFNEANLDYLNREMVVVSLLHK
jgi:hypothetical protein